jgi:hypothetical protein
LRRPVLFLSQYFTSRFPFTLLERTSITRAADDLSAVLPRRSDFRALCEFRERHSSLLPPLLYIVLQHQPQTTTLHNLSTVHSQSSTLTPECPHHQLRNRQLRLLTKSQDYRYMSTD